MWGLAEATAWGRRGLAQTSAWALGCRVGQRRGGQVAWLGRRCDCWGRWLRRRRGNWLRRRCAGWEG
eukprot:scaffold24379_cov122-Isochrysis_galbana.AAC.5